MNIILIMLPHCLQNKNPKIFKTNNIPLETWTFPFKWILQTKCNFKMIAFNLIIHLIKFKIRIKEWYIHLFPIPRVFNMVFSILRLIHPYPNNNFRWQATLTTDHVSEIINKTHYNRTTLNNSILNFSF